MHTPLELINLYLISTNNTSGWTTYRAPLKARKISYCSFGSFQQTVFSAKRNRENSPYIYFVRGFKTKEEEPRDWPIGKYKGKILGKLGKKKKNQQKLDLMYNFQQLDEGGMAKSQLTTSLWFLLIWNASRKSNSNIELGYK